MSTKVIANRELLAGQKRRVVDVPVPELGEGVVIRLKQLPLHAIDEARLDSPRAEELSKMVVDENGELMFDSPEGVAIIGDWPVGIGIELMLAAGTLNVRSKEAVEATIKNLQSGPSAGSESVSPGS